MPRLHSHGQEETLDFREPDDAKVSRPVLNGRGAG
jgi:hypothetical protein